MPSINPETWNLLQAASPVGEALTARIALPDVTSRLQAALLAGEPEVLDQWEVALARAGYSAAYGEEYAKLRWRIVDEFLFNVTAEFPKLTRESLVDGLPTGVDGVGYDIHLEGFAGHTLKSQEIGRALA